MAGESETGVVVVGAEGQYGISSDVAFWRELAMKIAVKHSDPAGMGVVLKECVGLGLATPPGLSGFQGGRPKPSPVVRLFSFVQPKGSARIQIEIDGAYIECLDPEGTTLVRDDILRPAKPKLPESAELV